MEFQLEYFAGKRSREVRETLNWREKKSFFVDACGHLRGGGKKATKAPSGLGEKNIRPWGLDRQHRSAGWGYKKILRIKLVDIDVFYKFCHEDIFRIFVG